MKPNTYSQIYIQLVFAVSCRRALIMPHQKEALHKFITGVITKRGQKLYAIHAMPDHIHILVSISPSIKISDLVRDIKTTSSQYIRKHHSGNHNFKWQNGYGAFSYSKSHLDRVIRYIQNQEKHHAQKSFKKEYTTLLKKFEIPFEDAYLFKFVENN
ncbi:MAG: IS200/IS605 family transposase [Bacteroidia bacterium]